MRLYILAAVMVASLLPAPVQSSNAAWNDPSKSQYHIQTDEGPERYFRYQTLNGQYRKEKRLEDGTVIGTYGWVDDNGFFSMRDYIADNEGYRILKTKNVFVGRNTPVEQALSIAKKAPSSGGTSKTSFGSYSFTQPPPSQPSSAPVSYGYTPSSQSSYGYSPSSQPPTTGYTQPPVPSTGYLPFSASVQYTPRVEIVPHSGTESSLDAKTPSSTILPPISSTPETHIPTTTPATLTTVSSSSPSNAYLPQPTASTIPPPIGSNSVDFSGYSGDPQYEHYKDNFKPPFVNPYIHQNGPTYPIDRNGNTYNGYNNNNLGNGYDPQFPYYDGVAVTNDGFRYYLPRQYHEEQNLPGDQKSGSFGYIDPFGIRRVIYYNASPEKGFQHRKNNRYVGFNATPYDPRPY